MWAAILAIFPTIAGWANDIIGYFQNKAAEQTAADTAESSAETQHNNDGAQSVADKDSDDAQNDVLNKIDQQVDAAKAAQNNQDPPAPLPKT